MGERRRSRSSSKPLDGTNSSERLLNPEKLGLDFTHQTNQGVFCHKLIRFLIFNIENLNPSKTTWLCVKYTNRMDPADMVSVQPCLSTSSSSASFRTPRLFLPPSWLQDGPSAEVEGQASSSAGQPPAAATFSSARRHSSCRKLAVSITRSLSSSKREKNKRVMMCI